MARICDVAGYACEAYRATHGQDIDEMKLQKLLYFAQRESYALLGKELFEEDMEGWIHGPVSPQVRKRFHDGTLQGKNLDIASRRIVNNVVMEYGNLSSLSLREMSHREESWRNSRKGMAADAPGNNAIAKEDIRKDAMKVRPFDYAYGMYYDEFDDYDGGGDCSIQ